MRRSILGLALVLVSSSCGGPAAPEGFTIAVRFVAIDVAVVDRLAISFRPQGDARFEAQREMSFEGGAITTRVEDDGTLTMEITGDHVRAHATSPDGMQYLYEVQIWSEDEAMRAAPQMFGVAYRDGEAIGDGGAFLPLWPPPLSEDGTCTATSCRTQLAITCYTSTSARCRP